MIDRKWRRRMRDVALEVVRRSLCDGGREDVQANVIVVHDLDQIDRDLNLPVRQEVLEDRVGDDLAIREEMPYVAGIKNLWLEINNFVESFIESAAVIVPVLCLLTLKTDVGPDQLSPVRLQVGLVVDHEGGDGRHRDGR